MLRLHHAPSTGHLGLKFLTIRQHHTPRPHA
jgi:hypothetical protein